MPNLLVILNPTSARGKAARLIPAIQRCLAVHQLDYQLTITEEPKHAQALAYAACQQDFEIIVAGGGDGTVNEVVNGILQASKAGYRQPILGVLAIGQGNDFAYAAGIPPGVMAGCQNLANGTWCWSDVGYFEADTNAGPRYFVNGVGIGFDAVVSFQAARYTRLQGFLAYAIAAVKTIFLDFTPPHVRIEIDQVMLEKRCLMISVMNGRRMGGGFYMAPMSSLSDGLLSLCIAQEIPRLEMLAAIPKFLGGTQGRLEAITFAEARHVRVAALQGSLPIHGDGEVFSKAAGICELKIVPRALKVMTANLR